MRTILSTQNVPLTGELRRDLHHLIESAFDRFQNRVSHVRVALRDADGSATYVVCRLEAVWWGDNVVIEEARAEAEAAAALAAPMPESVDVVFGESSIIQD